MRRICCHAHDTSESDVGCSEYITAFNVEEYLDGGGCERVFYFSVAELPSRYDNGRIWPSKGFNSYSRTIHAKPPFSYLNSSWIWPLATRAWLREYSGMKSRKLDVENVFNRCYDPSMYENSRYSKQDFCSSPHAANGPERHSGVLDAREASQFVELEGVLAPRVLPTVVALLPSCVKSVDAKLHSTEKAGLFKASDSRGIPSEIKQRAHLFGGKNSEVSIEGLDSASKFGSGTGKSFYKPAEKKLELLPQGSDRVSTWRMAPAESGTYYSVGGQIRPRRLSKVQERRLLHFEDFLLEREVNAEIRHLQNDHTRRFPEIEHIDGSRFSRALESNEFEPGVEYPTFDPAYQTTHGEVVDRDSTSGLHHLCEGGLHYRDNQTETKESRHLFGGLRTNWLDFNLYSYRNFKRESYTEGFVEGSGSSSDCYEEIRDYTLPGHNKKSRHLLPVAHRKRSRELHDWPLLPTPRLHEEGFLRKSKMWIRRWSTTTSTGSLKAEPGANREIEGFERLCFDNHALGPSKRACHESFYDALKRDHCGFSCWRQRLMRSWEASTYSRTGLPPSPSSAAMAIVGATAKHAQGSELGRRALFGSWANPPQQSLNVTPCKARTTKGSKLLAKPVRL